MAALQEQAMRLVQVAGGVQDGNPGYRSVLREDKLYVGGWCREEGMR